MARITKSVQLIPGRDDDLIAWFDTLPDGQGQTYILDALRRGIQERALEVIQANMDSQEPAAIMNEERLREALDYLIEGIGDKFKKAVKNMKVVASSGDDESAPKLKERDDLFSDIMSGLASIGMEQ